MIKPAVTTAFENPDDVSHFKLESVHFLDAKTFKSGKLFEINSFFYLLDYPNYLRHEKEIKKRLKGKDAPSHPPLIVFGATAPLYQSPCLLDSNNIESSEASKLFLSWLSFAKVCHHFDHDAD